MSKNPSGFGVDVQGVKTARLGIQPPKFMEVDRRGGNPLVDIRDSDPEERSSFSVQVGIQWEICTKSSHQALREKEMHCCVKKACVWKGL